MIASELWNSDKKELETKCKSASVNSDCKCLLNLYSSAIVQLELEQCSKLCACVDYKHC